jgi:aspartate/methionine/tyrosine aminotransferase
MTPTSFRVDRDFSVEAASRPRTRAIIVNSPHNPSGTILRDDDMRQLRGVRWRTTCS